MLSASEGPPSDPLTGALPLDPSGAPPSLYLASPRPLAEGLDPPLPSGRKVFSLSAQQVSAFRKGLKKVINLSYTTLARFIQPIGDRL